LVGFLIRVICRIQRVKNPEQIPDGQLPDRRISGSVLIAV
jgi:hypothetical protein